MNSRQRRRFRRLSERMFKLCDLTRLRIAQDLNKFCAVRDGTARNVHVDCWCGGLGTKDDPEEDDGKKYCGCAVGEAAFLAACRARRALNTDGLEE